MNRDAPSRFLIFDSSLSFSLVLCLSPSHSTLPRILLGKDLIRRRKLCLSNLHFSTREQLDDVALRESGFTAEERREIKEHYISEDKAYRMFHNHPSSRNFQLTLSKYYRALKVVTNLPWLSTYSKYLWIICRGLYLKRIKSKKKSSLRFLLPFRIQQPQNTSVMVCSTDQYSSTPF